MVTSVALGIVRRTDSGGDSVALGIVRRSHCGGDKCSVRYSPQDSFWG